MMDWLDTHLIPQWRQAWRFTSVQLAAAAAAIGGVVTASPELLLALVTFLPAGGWLGPALVALVVVTVFVVPTVARLWDQEASNEPDDTDSAGA